MANKYFMCKTDKEPQTYRCGETVNLHIYYRDEGKTVPAHAFQWLVAGDFGLKEEGVSDGSTGELHLSAKLDQPGFIYVNVHAVDENGAPAAESDTLFAGAGVEIEKITSSTTEPEGYREFWEVCRKELFCVDPDPIEMTKLPETPLHPNHDTYDVRIACAGGIPVSGILTIPRGDKKYPAKVVYQGYGVKSAWYTYSDDAIVLCINAHGIKNGEPQSYYDELTKGRLAGYGFDAEQNKNPHTCYFKYMMIRAGQALRYMMTRPEWDGVNLIARGGSQGGVQAMQASFLIPEVTMIDIWVPWLCDINAASTGRLCGWGDFSGSAIRYFDTSLRARYITQKTVILAGLGDYTSPPAGIVAMFHNLRGERTLYLAQGREHIYTSPETETFEVKEN
ncbi:MAG: acetylxylan esterase [Clostridia bacterium]|nr:acetylxylan esterase [Clostridia bacterium]